MEYGHFPSTRLKRLRQNASFRNLTDRVQLAVPKFIYPLFIRYGTQLKNPIITMPGQFQFSVDNLASEIESLTALGIQAVMLFGIPATKDATGSDSYSDQGIIQTAIPVIRQIAPDLLIATDVCFCEYTDHGHCGVLRNHPSSEVVIDNDKTLHLLAKQAVSHAKAGANLITPSGNVDGMVGAIRTALDEAGYSHIPILSHAIKYASSFYGPFRQAAEGAPKFGDRRTYQMDFTRPLEGLRECALDIAEGVDMLMVKPAHTYLDIISQVKQNYPTMPLGAYHTSGEFAMLKAAAANGWINEPQAVIEVLTAIHRAGADFIITYYAKEVATWLAKNN